MPLTPPPPLRATNAIFPPTHHSLLGGQSLAKLSTKIKLRCRFLPIALNRADWIRIFLFSSHLDHLGDWGPREGWDQVGEGTEARNTTQHFSALESGGEDVDAPPTSPPFSGVSSLPAFALCSQAGQARPGWVLLSSVCSQPTPSRVHLSHQCLAVLPAVPPPSPNCN